jgi:hypothetical protein
MRATFWESLDNDNNDTLQRLDILGQTFGNTYCPEDHRLLSSLLVELPNLLHRHCSSESRTNQPEHPYSYPIPRISSSPSVSPRVAAHTGRKSSNMGCSGDIVGCSPSHIALQS